ncbi:hypothetical protein MKX01_033306 [Papaver californicum]|nr:hypothetical protein MKX01_033306 [Papaver californicum]
MEIPKLIKLGGSLIVPSVQELAKQSPAEVPDRYIRNDQDPVVDVSGASMTDQTIPVIDLQNLLSQEHFIGELELERLYSACKDWGFFQVCDNSIMIVYSNLNLSVGRN